ncbi:MAG: hypothetical protein PWP07_2235 [Epulopiscium sp.]|jgi:hypothetical protein|nr:hypothetical protein [Thermoanaerobacter sp.]MDK2788990.1 hypothetical protein [Candidatus Epulonipiscium sp.]
MLLKNKGQKISFFKGTLGDAWNIKKSSCTVTIYSNGIEIKSSFPDGRDFCQTYEFDNVNELKIDKRIEERKKLFHTSKIIYLTLTIKGMSSIPEIIVSEKDYERLKRELEAYFSQLKIKEETERIAKEKAEKFKKAMMNRKIKSEQFKTDIINYFDSLSLFYKCVKLNADTIQKEYIQDKIQGGSIFDYIVSAMYERIDGTDSILLTQMLLNDVIFAKDIMNNTICYIKPNLEYSIPDSLIIKTIENFLSIFSTEVTDVYIFKTMYCMDNTLESYENLFIELSEIDSYSLKTISYFCIIYSFAYSLIKMLVFCKNFNKFSSNDELMTMFMNLRNNTNMETYDISEKLYPIYKNYYVNTFEIKMNKHEFASFLRAFDLYNIFINNRNPIVYNEEIVKLKETLNKDIFQYSDNDYPYLEEEFKKLLMAIDNKKYFEIFNVPYDLNYKYIDSVYEMFYDYLLRHIGNILPSEVFFKLFFVERVENTALLKKKQEYEIIKQERDRLLCGDISKEKEQEYDKYCYGNITTGYEFEEYIKTIFEKMGYDVIMTKKSNDQGGDLIIEKDGIRTIVQTKFYSNPVGNKAVQEVVAAKSYYKANNGMIVTNSKYTNSAITLAQANDIILIDGEELDKIRDKILELI